MNFETYLTQTIQDAVKEAVVREFDELKKTLIHFETLQSRSTQTQTSTSQKEIIRPKELGEMLSLSISTIYKMYNEGQLPLKVKISSRVVGWLRSDIEEWLLLRKER
ncbi:helix-turn-helix transcriptional regulator [Rhodohalobacter sulfatireducens]|uniref:AlpA family phage regulatory protein n=1 Tax=Rhodohalobacter sulfatireducens TaxID=2911366 RepID=A0ABS9KF79_9BACT|nr:AlpA family phage regulatory protein [Rhodohalobacter sulfatireducens]MCG2589513.1 AlpA family phage regulatory protein [Rhodohalobacter sulfatireducens]